MNAGKLVFIVGILVSGISQADFEPAVSKGNSIGEVKASPQHLVTQPKGPGGWMPGHSKGKSLEPHRPVMTIAETKKILSDSHILNDGMEYKLRVVGDLKKIGKQNSCYVQTQKNLPVETEVTATFNELPPLDPRVVTREERIKNAEVALQRIGQQLQAMTDRQQVAHLQNMWRQAEEELENARKGIVSTTSRAVLLQNGEKVGELTCSVRGNLTFGNFSTALGDTFAIVGWRNELEDRLKRALQKLEQGLLHSDEEMQERARIRQFAEEYETQKKNEFQRRLRLTRP